MACNNQIGEEINGLEKKLQIKANILGMYKAHKVFDTYLTSRTESAWDEEVLKGKPLNKGYDALGAIDGVDGALFTITSHTPTGTVLPDLAGGLAIFYDKTELDAKIAANDLVNLLDISHTAIPIISSTASSVTVESDIPTGYTQVYLMEEAYHDLPLATNYNFAFSSDLIDVTNQSSGGVLKQVAGISDASLSGIEGNYSIDYHVIFQLKYMNLKKGCTIDVRHFASLRVDEPVYYQSVYANEFSTTGGIMGDVILTYTGNFANAGGYPAIKSVVTEGVIPSL